MKSTPITFLTVLALAPAACLADYCFKKVENKIAKQVQAKSSFDVDYYSQSDLTQKVVGPLRKNRLSAQAASEIRRLSEDKSNKFFQLSIWDETTFRSELLLVNGKNCEIVSRYVLLNER